MAIISTSSHTPGRVRTFKGHNITKADMTWAFPQPEPNPYQMEWEDLIDAIRNDPQWMQGDYKTQPPGLRTAGEMLWLMGSNPVRRQKEAPTRADADRVLEAYVANFVKTYDANDVLYALESSADYDPAPALEKITAPLLAINSADDLINPPELGIL